jgi:hypothetical protein
MLAALPRRTVGRWYAKSVSNVLARSGQLLQSKAAPVWVLFFAWIFG